MKAYLRYFYLFIIGILLFTATVVSAATSYNFTKTLSLGMSGEAVTALQTILMEQGFYTYPRITGYFGITTQGAVKAFQAAKGLSQVGSVGPQTRAALNSLNGGIVTQLQTPVVNTPVATPTQTRFTRSLSIGARGADVTALQTLLKAEGVYTYPTITGYYGPTTQAAVKAFQEKYASEILAPSHLVQGTGSVGPATLSKLNTISAAPTLARVIDDEPLPSCVAPDISSSLSASANVGSSFSYTIFATGIPTSYTAANLPPGLSLSGSTISGTPITAGTYSTTIRAINDCQTDTRTLTITVASSGSPTVTLTSSAALVTTGTSATLTWSSTNVTTCTASNGWGGTKTTSGSENTGNLTATKIYTITCTGTGGTATKSVTVSVAAAPQVLTGPAPTITFKPVFASVNVGGSAILNWSTTNATYCEATEGWTGSKPTTGTELSPKLTTSARTASFSIACGGPGGTTTKSTSITVIQPPPPAPTADGITAQNILVVYNNNYPESVALKDYYLSHRPGFSNVNTVAVNPPLNEYVESSVYTANIETPINAWLTQNPSVTIKYIVLMNRIPTRMIDGGGSTQYRLFEATGAHVTSLDMGSQVASLAYIDKISGGSDLIISGSALGKVGTTYYFDETTPIHAVTPLKIDRDYVLGVNSSASTVYQDTSHISTASDVAGYETWGANGGQGKDYALDGSVVFSGKSNWYLIKTIESYNGQYADGYGQGNLVKWFAANAFGGSNYSNTPVGAVTHTSEPGLGGTNNTEYLKLWEQGKTFVEAAWGSRATQYFAAIGDPLVKK